MKLGPVINYLLNVYRYFWLVSSLHKLVLFSDCVCVLCESLCRGCGVTEMKPAQYLAPIMIFPLSEVNQMTFLPVEPGVCFIPS